MKWELASSHIALSRHANNIFLSQKEIALRLNGNK